MQWEAYDIINDFSGLRPLEIVTNMRNPGYRPSYLCLFAHEFVLPHSTSRFAG